MKIISWNTPHLVTLYVSEWAGTGPEISALIKSLAPSLLHLYLCEVVNLDGQHMQAIWESQPRLQVANFFASAERPVKQGKRECVCGANFFFSCSCLSTLHYGSI